MESTDAALLERWQRQRDADAFSELVHRYSGMVFTSCKRILADPAGAEDVAQECFIELMRTRDSIRASLGGWLHTIAVRRCMDRMKGEARRRKREDRFAEIHPVEQDVSDHATAEILAYVDEAIEALPRDLKDVIVARFLEGQSHIALAQHLGIAESTVRYRVDRGVGQIRHTLEKNGVAVAVAALTSALSRPSEAAPPTMISALGKLALSGLSPTGAGLVGTAISLPKIAAGLVIVAAVGVGLWAGFHSNSDNQVSNPPAMKSVSASANQTGRETATTNASEAPTRPLFAETTAAIPGNNAVAAHTLTESDEFAIRGRVYDRETGKGIAGARVRVYPSGGGREAARSEPTDSEGAYVIPTLDEGMFTVSIEKLEEYPDPRGSHNVSVTVKHGEPLTDIDFPLEKGICIAGVVVDEKGKPIADAKVGAKSPMVPNPISVESKRDGLFELFMPEPTENLMIQAQTEEFESITQMDLTLTRDGLGGLTLKLDQPRTATLSGVVVDGAGAGVDGANLHLLNTSRRVFAYGPGGATDSKGVFRVDKCAAGEYAIIVTPKGAHGFSTSDECMRVTLALGQTLEGITIVYGEKGGLSIAGRVVNSDGQPIRQATILCFGENMERAYTKDDGAFSITGLKEMEYGISVEHLQYSRANTSILAGTLDAEIVLKERGAISGRVIRADTGQPLTTYSLGFIYGEVRGFDEMLFGSGKAIESADGSFTFDKLDAGSVAVAAWAPGLAPVWRNVTVEEKKATTVEFALEAVPPLEGSVVDEAGNPIAGAGVYFVEGVSVDTLDRAATTRTDNEGRFTLDSLPLDAVRVCAYHAGFGIGVCSIPSDGRIVLPAAGTVEGIIRGDDMVANKMAVNALYPEDRHLPYSYTTPRDDGSFRLTGLTPGEIRISVYPNGGPRHTIEKTARVEKGQTTRVEFIFEKGPGTLEGRLTVSGVPLSKAWLQLERKLDDRTERLDCLPDMDGNYRFEGVWPGELTLTVSRVAPDNPYEPVKNELTLTMPEGGVLRQDIELPPLE